MQKHFANITGVPMSKSSQQATSKQAKIAHNKQTLSTSKNSSQQAKIANEQNKQEKSKKLTEVSAQKQRLTGVSDRLTGVSAKSDSKEHQRLTAKKERHRVTKSAKNSQRAKRATPTAKIMAQMRIVTKQHKI